MGVRSKNFPVIKKSCKITSLGGKMKKFFSILLVLSILTLCSCGKKGDPYPKKSPYDQIQKQDKVDKDAKAK